MAYISATSFGNFAPLKIETKNRPGGVNLFFCLNFKGVGDSKRRDFVQ